MLYNHFARQANTMLTVAENHARALRAQLAEFRVREPAAATGTTDDESTRVLDAVTEPSVGR